MASFEDGQIYCDSMPTTVQHPASSSQTVLSSPGGRAFRQPIFTPPSTNGYAGQLEAASPSPIRLGSPAMYSPGRDRAILGSPGSEQGTAFSTGHHSMGNTSQVAVSSTVQTPSLYFDPIEGGVTVPSVLPRSRRATCEYGGTTYQLVIPEVARPGQHLPVTLRGVESSPALPAPSSWVSSTRGGSMEVVPSLSEAARQARLAKESERNRARDVLLAQQAEIRSESEESRRNYEFLREQYELVQSITRDRKQYVQSVFGEGRMEEELAEARKQDVLVAELAKKAKEAARSHSPDAAALLEMLEIGSVPTSTGQPESPQAPSIDPSTAAASIPSVPLEVDGIPETHASASSMPLEERTAPPLHLPQPLPVVPVVRASSQDGVYGSAIIRSDQASVLTSSGAVLHQPKDGLHASIGSSSGAVLRQPSPSPCAEALSEGSVGNTKIARPTLLLDQAQVPSQTGSGSSKIAIRRSALRTEAPWQCRQTCPRTTATSTAAPAAWRRRLSFAGPPGANPLQQTSHAPISSVVGGARGPCSWNAPLTQAPLHPNSSQFRVVTPQPVQTQVPTSWTTAPASMPAPTRGRMMMRPTPRLGWRQERTSSPVAQLGYGFVCDPVVVTRLGS